MEDISNAATTDMKLYYDGQDSDAAGWLLVRRGPHGEDVTLDVNGDEDASIDYLADQIDALTMRPTFPRATCKIVVYRGDLPTQQIVLVDGEVTSRGHLRT